MRRDVPQPTRILLASQPGLGSHLQQLLADPCFEVTNGVIATVEDLAQALDRTRPDVLLLDDALPGLDALAALEAISRRKPFPRVLLVAATYSIDLSLAQELPACYGTLLRELALTPLLPPVVRGIAAGSTYYLPPPKPSDLTPHQYGVLRLMALGLDTYQLAQALRRSINSIYSVQGQIRRKLGVETNQQAIVTAIRLRLVAVLKNPDQHNLPV